MRTFLIRTVIVIVAIFSLSWSLISVSTREMRRSAKWVWLDLKVEWWSVVAAWKRKSL